MIVFGAKKVVLRQTSEQLKALFWDTKMAF